MSVAEHIQTGLAMATLPLAVYFIWLYAKDPWWRQWFGRSLMILAVGVFCYTLSVTLFRLLGRDYPGREVLIVLAQGLTFVAMLIRTAVLKSAQRADRRRLMGRY